MAHKDDGNEQFKKKRYKAAITAYTAGLKEKAEDSELTAILFCNRAAANYHLGQLYKHSLEASSCWQRNSNCADLFMWYFRH